MTEKEKNVRQQIEIFFKNTARKTLSQTEKVSFESLLDPNDEGKRILFVIPESIGDVFMASALFRSIADQYPWGKLHVATNPAYFSLLKGNPYVSRLLPYIPEMDNLHFNEGIGNNHKGFFEISFLPYILTQRIQGYQHNGLDKIPFDIRYPACET